MLGVGKCCRESATRLTVNYYFLEMTFGDFGRGEQSWLFGIQKPDSNWNFMLPLFSFQIKIGEVIQKNNLFYQ